MKAIQTWATMAGLASGFALMGHKEPPLDLLITSLAINLTLAPLTAIVASRRSRSATTWVLLGLVFGVWALAASLLLASWRKAPRAPSGPDQCQPPRAA
ncbi:MAG TPA: hypothetical protein VKV28_11610 [Candidatus Binataceae bacterium]|nr:hypothetical protein [Candidatus Binataceae bacterium]